VQSTVGGNKLNSSARVMDQIKSIKDLYDELEVMSEYLIIEQIRHFSSSLEIFKGNYRELKDYVNFHNNPFQSRELFSVSNRHKLFLFQLQVMRLLHNYVASAFSLIDHTRNHYKGLYSKNNKFPEYEEEVKNRFIDVPIANFTKELRQYIQHYDLPVIVSKTKYISEPPTLTQKLTIKKEKLNSFSWNSKSKEYLKSLPDDIDLNALIDTYYEIVENFYDWFKLKQQMIHEKELFIVNQKKRVINKLLLPNLIDVSINDPEFNYINFEQSILSIDEQNELNQFTDLNLRVEKLINILNPKCDFNDDLIEKIKMIYK
jgi:hypothetical protein